MTDDTPVVRATPDFAAFYRSEYQGVLGVMLARTRDRAAAEDLAQEAFLRAHRDWDALADHPNPEAWVRRVALNLAVSRGRRLAAEARALLRLGRTEPSGDELPAEATRFWDAVARLPRRQAEAVVLHYVEDRSVADVALVLGTSEGTVKTHLHRAREALAARLREGSDS